MKRISVFVAASLALLMGGNIGTALADGTIDMANPVSGEGWTYSAADGTVQIVADGSYAVSGVSVANRLVVNAGVTATVTLTNVSLHGLTRSPFVLLNDSAGKVAATVTLRLEGHNRLSTAAASLAGLTVEGLSQVIIEGSGRASLVAIGGSAAIGGSRYETAGIISLTGGTIYASGGIGGDGNGGQLRINGATVVADEIGRGSTTLLSGKHTLAMANTFHLTAADTASGFYGATVLGGKSVNVLSPINPGDALTDVTLYGSLTIGEGVALSVPSGVLFDFNNQTVRNNGEIWEDGTILHDEQLFTVLDAECAEITAQTYTGEALEPTLKVRDMRNHRAADKGVAHLLALSTDYTILSYHNNTEAGEATVTIEGQGKYNGTVTVAFTIRPQSIVPLVAIHNANALPDYPYTGKAQEPAVEIVMKDSVALTLDKDYRIEYQNNVNAGEAVVLVRGIGNYTDTVGAPFTIIPQTLSGDSVRVTLTVDSFAYRGDSIKPQPTVWYGQRRLVESTDYTLSYYQCVEIGVAVIRITGVGNYRHYVDREFTIYANPSIYIAYIEEQIYTGSPLRPEVIVIDGRAAVYDTLVPNRDYFVTYDDNNLNVGTATVSITGRGNYAGVSATRSFTILPKELTGDMIEDLPSFVYTGAPITPDLTIMYGNLALRPDSDYVDIVYADNENAGVATVSLTGRGNYIGEVTKTFIIAPKSLTECTLPSLSDYPFTGDSIEPAITIIDGAKTLEAGKDYDITYSDNVNAGTGKVTVSGKGNYAGTVVLTFFIGSRADFYIDFVTEEVFIYTGSPFKPEIIVKDSLETVLSEGVHYIVRYTDNTNAGQAIVTAEGIGNYSGTASLTFTIVPKELPANCIRTTQGTTLEPVIKDGDRTLTKGKDYVVTASPDNVITGTVQIKVIGIGNYTGSVTGTFEILLAGIGGVPAENVTIVSLENKVLVGGLPLGITFNIYTLSGQCVYSARATLLEEQVILPARGIYVLRYGDKACTFGF